MVSNVSNSEMSDFFVEQGRSKIFGEAYFLYAAIPPASGRTPFGGKIAIYGWTLAIDRSVILTERGFLR